MAGEVEKAGRGFLTAAGEVKDKRTLATEEAKSRKSRSPASSDTIKNSQDSSRPDFSESSVRGAFRSVRNRFNEEANSFANVVNESDESLRKAEENVKAQLETARGLKSALDSGDAQTAAEKREELEKLQRERDQLARQIEQDNGRRAADRSKTFSLGSEQKGQVSVEKVNFQESDRSRDLESKDSINQLIQDLKSEREGIKAQREGIKAVRKEVKTIVKQARDEIERIENATLNSVGEAQKTALSVASQIVQAGAQASVVSNVDESVVRSLTEA
ncbi:MAG: hypothetical protein J5J00_02710 [Deltaproteobacteria bacterium]|nr:hypothetical protein [Deltaproteobacteria bacterium]